MRIKLTLPQITNTLQKTEFKIYLLEIHVKWRVEQKFWVTFPQTNIIQGGWIKGSKPWDKVSINTYSKKSTLFLTSLWNFSKCMFPAFGQEQHLCRLCTAFLSHSRYIHFRTITKFHKLRVPLETANLVPVAHRKLRNSKSTISLNFLLFS